MATALRTVLVDLTPRRAATRRLLVDIPTLTLVGEYRDLAEALPQAPATRPDLSRRRGRWQRVAGGVDSGHDDRAAGTQAAGNGDPRDGTRVSAELVIRVLRAGALEFLRCPLERVDLVAALEKLARFRGSAPQRNPGRITSRSSPPRAASARRRSRSIWPSRWPSAPKARRCSWSSTPGSRIS